MPSGKVDACRWKALIPLDPVPYRKITGISKWTRFVLKYLGITYSFMAVRSIDLLRQVAEGICNDVVVLIRMIGANGRMGSPVPFLLTGKIQYRIQ